MAITTILQADILTKFVYPFLLIFFIVFAILEKTKIFGEEKKQINALVAFVIGLIFISVVTPKMIVGNLILFLTIALVVVFVVLLLWGFVTGGEAKMSSTAPKIIFGILIGLGVVITLLAATGYGDDVYKWLFKQSWSSDLWTNVAFIVVIAIAFAVALKSPKGK
jgi:hypothetical protein